MRLAALCVCGTLLAFSSSPGVCTTPGEGSFQWGTEPGSCRVTLKPAGECGGEGMDTDACPYQMILPPLDIMLPRQLRELERTVKEVQKLKETVEQLRRACLECKMSHRERMEGRAKDTMKGDKEKTTSGLGDRHRETEEEEDKVRLGMDERERGVERERMERQGDREMEMDMGGKGARDRERRIEGEGEAVSERVEEKETNMKEEKKRKQEKKFERDREGNLKDPTKREGQEGREKEISAEERRRKGTIEKDSGNDRGSLWLEKVQTKKDSQVDELRQKHLERENTPKEERAREQNPLRRKNEKETQGEKEQRKERDRERQTQSYGQIEDNNQSQLETGKTMEKEGEKTVQSVQRDSTGTVVTDGTRQDQDMASSSPSPGFSQYSIPRTDSPGPDQISANPSSGSSTYTSSCEAPCLNSNSMLGSSTTSSPKSSFISSTTTTSIQTTTSSIKQTASPRTRAMLKKHKPKQIEKPLNQNNLSSLATSVTILSPWTTTSSSNPVSTRSDKSQDLSSTITRSWWNRRPINKPKPGKKPRPGLQPSPGLKPGLKAKPGQKLIPGLQPQPGRKPPVKSTSPIPTNSFSINLETSRTDSDVSTTISLSPGVSFLSPSLQTAKTSTQSSDTAGQSTSPGYRSTTSSPGDRINIGRSLTSGTTTTAGISSRTIHTSSTIESQWNPKPGIQGKPDIRPKLRPRPGPKLNLSKMPRPPSLVNSSRSIPETTPRPRSTPDTITSLSLKTTSSSSSTTSFNHGISFTTPSLGSKSRIRAQIPSSSSWTRSYSSSSIKLIPNQGTTTTDRFIMRTTSPSLRVGSWWTSRPGLKLKPDNRPLPGQGLKPGPKTKPKPVLKPRTPSSTNSSNSIPKKTPEPGIIPDTITSENTSSLGSLINNSNPEMNNTSPSPGSFNSIMPINYPENPTIPRIKTTNLNIISSSTSSTPATTPTTSPTPRTSFTSHSSRTPSMSSGPEITNSISFTPRIKQLPGLRHRPKLQPKPILRPELKPKPGPKPIPGLRPKPGKESKPDLKPRSPSSTSSNPKNNYLTRPTLTTTSLSPGIISHSLPTSKTSAIISNNTLVHSPITTTKITNQRYRSTTSSPGASIGSTSSLPPGAGNTARPRSNISPSTRISYLWTSRPSLKPQPGTRTFPGHKAGPMLKATNKFRPPSPASSSSFTPETTTRPGSTQDTIPTAQIISISTWTASYSTSGITLNPILGTTTTAGSISRTTSPSSRIGSRTTHRPGLKLKPGTRRIPGRRPKPGQKPKHFLKPRQPSTTGFSKSIPKTTPKAVLTTSSNPNSQSPGSLTSFTTINSPETTTVPITSIRTTSIELSKTHIPPSPTRSSPRPGSIPDIIISLSSKTNHPRTRTNGSKHFISFTTPSSASVNKTVQIANPSTTVNNQQSTIKTYNFHSSRTISAKIIPQTNSAERHETSSTTLRLSIKPKPIIKPKPDSNHPGSKSKPGPQFRHVLMPRPPSPTSSSSSRQKITPRIGTTLPTNTGQNPEARTSTSQMERKPKTEQRPFPGLQPKPRQKPVLKPRPASVPRSKTTTQNPRITYPIPSRKTSPGTMTTIISQKLTTSSNQLTSTSPSPKSTTTSTIQLVNSYNIPTTANHDSPTPSPISESSTPSVRELRVKTIQTRLNDTKDTGEGSIFSQPGLNLLSEKDQGHNKIDRTRDQPQSPAQILTEVAMAPKDCSDHMVRGERKSGVYQVTPDPKNQTFSVLCEMESQGGGWTIIQHRQDGSVNFNRTWAEYRTGFGDLRNGEFWLGNDHIHLLTRHRNMVLRVELEDFNSMKEYAEYKVFRVAGERLRYRLFVGGYSGTAGDALQFSRSYNHNNRFFTTPDRDYDRYPSGNCGSYYSSGWWFDACMAANLNGRYYVGKYKGVRNGIFWGTWHNISTEYYPTNDRQSFKVVRMMIRPRGYSI